MHLHEFTTCRGYQQISPPGAKDLERMNIHEPGFIEYQAREYGNHAVADKNFSLREKKLHCDRPGSQYK